MKKLLVVVLLAGAGFAAGYGYGRWYAWPKAAAKKAARGYHCPMHPQMKDDHASDCPICGMKLVPDEPSVLAQAAEGGGRILYYQDPRKPDYRSDKPGLNPETGNELVAVREQPAAGVLTIPAEKQQWIGLKTEVAGPHGMGETLRLAGRVAVDESRVQRVQTRLEGWIERVYVDYTGRLVRKGEPMVTIYSPELVASQQEYLLALRARETMQHSMVAGASHSGETLAEAARERLLHHWGMDPSAVAEIEKTSKPQRSMTVYAPADGYVLERKAFVGQMAKPEMELYTLADLSRVWVIADLNESDAAQVRPGSVASVQPAYAPGRRFRATVEQILPQVDATTRTLKVRMLVENTDLSLKPDLFLNVDFGIGGGARVAVSEDALVDTGNTQIVYVDLGEGRFEPRKVVAGERTGGYVAILHGVKAGERVVSSGAFLLDSESRLRSGAK
jgi:RND family efflux transporter MFP subunit